MCIKGKLKKPKATSSGEEGPDQAIDKVPRKRRQAATVGGDKAVAAKSGGNKRKRDVVQEEAALPILPIPLKVRKARTDIQAFLEHLNTPSLMHLFLHIYTFLSR